jgi:hypothetical protein
VPRQGVASRFSGEHGVLCRMALCEGSALGAWKSFLAWLSGPFCIVKEPGNSEPAMAAVVAAWPDLPTVIKAGIEAIVKASRP